MQPTNSKSDDEDYRFYNRAKQAIALALRAEDSTLSLEERKKAQEHSRLISLEQAESLRDGPSLFKIHVLEVKERDEDILNRSIINRFEDQEVINFWHRITYQYQLKTLNLVVFIQSAEIYVFTSANGRICGTSAANYEKWPVPSLIPKLLLTYGILPEHFWKAYNSDPYSFIQSCPFVTDLKVTVNDMQEALVGINKILNI